MKYAVSHAGQQKVLKGAYRDGRFEISWPVWMHLGQNVNRFWLVKFYDYSLILQWTANFSLGFMPKLFRDSKNL
jgi:hypothetical protein